MSCETCEHYKITHTGKYIRRVCGESGKRLNSAGVSKENDCTFYKEKKIEKEDEEFVVKSCMDCEDYLASMNVCCNEKTMKLAIRKMQSQVVGDPNKVPEFCPRRLIK